MSSPSRIRNILTSKHGKIVTQIVAEVLLSHMIEAQIFTIQEAEMVEATNGGMTARARKLISLLDRKTDDKLLVFVQCLRAGAHSHVADMFDGEEEPHITAGGIQADSGTAPVNTKEPCTKSDVDEVESAATASETNKETSSEDDKNRAMKLKDRILSSSTPIETKGPKINYQVQLKEREYRNPGDIRVKTLAASGSNVLKMNEKVILVVGASGSGKSTWINALFNHIVGVEYEDDFRFKLVTGEGGATQAHSQTHYTTIYTLQHMDGMAVNYTLTIVDTPGFGDTRGIALDKHIQKQLCGIFDTSNGGIDHLNAVGFVIQSSAARLTETQKYIFDSILGLFGYDIRENIFILFTFADAMKPKALAAVKQDGMQYQTYFKFNNSAFFQDVAEPNEAQNDDCDDEDDSDVDSFKQMFWKIGMKYFSNLLTRLKDIHTKSISLTRDVLQKRENLEKRVEHLRQQVTDAVQVFEQIQVKKAMLQCALQEVESSKDYTYMVKQSTQDKEEGVPELVCLMCNFICHDGCKCKNDDSKLNCSAMDQTKYPPSCRKCPGRCQWDLHRVRPYKLRCHEKIIEVTYHPAKEHHDRALKQKLIIEQAIKEVQSELEAVKNQIESNLFEITVSIETLNRIALRNNHLSQIDYLDFLIQSEKHRARPGWKERVGCLEAYLEHAKILHDIYQRQFDPFAKYKQ